MNRLLSRQRPLRTFRLSPLFPIRTLLPVRHFHVTKPTYSKITKEQLLKNSTNWISRLNIRFKWLLKRSNRPFNTDDYSAIFSWLVISNALLVILGTTTFFSLIILTANTVFAQEFVARKFGELITENSKLSVIFENAIVPGWKDGKITFKKCLVSRRPKLSKKFIKGSQQSIENQEIDDGNYTQFDLSIEEVNITLSFNKWVNGKGIIDTMELKGIRGVVDRTHVYWDVNDNPLNYKNVYHPGDFEIDNFKMDDILIKLLQPNGFRPFNVEVYNCHLLKLRKHWLFYDFLNASIMSGSYDGSLFTIHKKQRFNEFSSNDNGNSLENYKLQRLRCDSLNIDHLNTGLEGPFGWITKGKVDMIGDLLIPIEDNYDLLSIFKHDKGEKSILLLPSSSSPGNNVKLNLTIKLYNVRASVPFQNRELSYINYALIKPIVAYINSKNTYIEINNHITKPEQDFDGSWTIYDSLLMDDISIEVYDNFVKYVADEESRLTRMKKVSFWSMQLLLQVVLLSIGALS